MNVTLPDHIHHLAVEGVIGVGKTTLCRLLANSFNARLVLEQADENPFLHKFYRQRSNYAFQTQLWFLVSRYRQFSEAFIQQNLFHPVIITDYMFAKDRIFASINLDEDELSLYDTIARSLERDIPKPDFVVFLQASTEILLKRIEKRARPYEFAIDPAYIDVLNEAYSHFFFHYTDSPVLVINTSDIDFVAREHDLEVLIEQIAEAKPGANFFHPISNGPA
jgi:deoxyguanosine kinase